MASGMFYKMMLFSRLCCSNRCINTYTAASLSIVITTLVTKYSFHTFGFLWNHQQCCWFLYVEKYNFGETNPNTEPQKVHANRDMFWWRMQDLRLCDVNTNVCDSPNNFFSIQKKSLFFFLISLFVSFFPLLISIWKKFYMQKIGRRDYHLFGAMHITLRGLRFFDVGIIYPVLGKVLYQISFKND